MQLVALIDTFLVDYKIECVKRGLKQIDFPPRYLASMLSRVLSDLQKRLGVLEVSEDVLSTANEPAYELPNMIIKSVTYGGEALKKASTQWIKSQTASSGVPEKYAILYEDSEPQLLLYPTPVSSDDAIVVQGEMDFRIYSPASSNDILFNGTTFSGSSAFPAQYDAALLLGMMKHIFKDIEADYEKEVSLLRVKQYNGESFEYKMD